MANRRGVWYWLGWFLCVLIALLLTLVLFLYVLLLPEPDDLPD